MPGDLGKERCLVFEVVESAAAWVGHKQMEIMVALCLPFCLCQVRRVACGGTMWEGCHVVVPCEKGAACYSKAAVSVRAHDTFTHSVLRFDACLLPEIFNVLPSVSLHSCVACLGDSLCRPAWSRGKGYCFGVYISIWEGGMFSRGAGRLLFMRMCVIIPFLGRLLYVVCAAFCVPYISLY